MHPPRDDFIATMTRAGHSAFDAHAAWLRGLLADGVLAVSGPCLGQVNTGLRGARRGGGAAHRGPAAGICAVTSGRTGSPWCVAAT